MKMKPLMPGFETRVIPRISSYPWNKKQQGRIYVEAGGMCNPDSLVALLPQIQKLDDLSDVIFEVLKCSKMQIFRGSPDPLADGEGARCSPPKNPTPAVGPSGLVSTGLRG